MKTEKMKSSLSKEDLNKWIKFAEKCPTISLEKFNEKWEEKKLKIKRHQL